MKTTLSILSFLLGFGVAQAQTTDIVAQSTEATPKTTHQTIKIRGAGITEDGLNNQLFVVFANNVEIKRMKRTDSLDLKSLDPQDIESINVLKNSSATKKYSWEGENGVVEIYLKNGKALKKP